MFRIYFLVRILYCVQKSPRITKLFYDLFKIITYILNTILDTYCEVKK